MQKGKNLILQIKNIIYSKTFQKIHCVEFYTNKKTSFSTVFSMILKLVKKSLGIECELMEPLTCTLKASFSKARYKICHTGFQEFKHPNSLSG